MIRTCAVQFISLQLFFSAKAKLLKWKVHETGGGTAPAKFNRIEEAVIRLLGSTPEFAGIVSDYFGDSRIEMRKGPNNNDLQAKVCKAKKVGQTSTLVRAMNTSKYNMAFNFCICVSRCQSFNAVSLM